MDNVINYCSFAFTPCYIKYVLNVAMSYTAQHIDTFGAFSHFYPVYAVPASFSVPPSLPLVQCLSLLAVENACMTNYYISLHLYIGIHLWILYTMMLGIIMCFMHTSIKKYFGHENVCALCWMVYNYYERIYLHVYTVCYKLFVMILFDTIAKFLMCKVIWL